METRNVSFLLCFASLAALSVEAQTPIDASRAMAVNAPRATTPSLPGVASLLGGPWSDDFNRPDAPTLGPDWTTVGGTLSITTNKAHGYTGSATQWARHNSATGSYDTLTASVDFLPAPLGPSTVYVALIFGEGAGSDAILIKTQDNNSDGLYDRVFFYKTVGFGGWSATYYFDLAVPTASGRMTCYFTGAGDIANLDIDSDFNGTVDEHFEVPGLLTANLTLGTNTGVAAFGNVEFDNWNATDGAVGPSIVSYCTPGTTTNGCTPTMAGVGTPSASQPSGFFLECNGVEGQRTGLIFYGASGQLALPWGPSSSYLCVKSPVQRTPSQGSGGTLAACDGQLRVDFLDFVANNPSAAGAPFSAGDVINAQGWFRDPPSPKTTMLSDGLEVTLAP